MSDLASAFDNARQRAQELSRGPSPLPASAGEAPPVIREYLAALKTRPKLLVPEELERFKDLLVFARSTVEGFFAGIHKSPYRGASVEFTDYKEYVPGDDVARLDWRAYGRTRRLFVRQYEAETDMVVYLVVDTSASMNYSRGGRQSKHLLSARIAAALAWLMIHQGDKVSLVAFSESVDRFLSPGGTRNHLHNIVSDLEKLRPASGTGIGRALDECNSLFRKRGRVVVLSDFWTDPAGLFDAVGQLLHRKFEVLLLQVMDLDEMDLPAVNSARFTDMETGEQVRVDPDEIRTAYRRAMQDRIDHLAREASLRGITHAVVNTRDPYLDAIEAYLGFRGKNIFG